MAATEKVIKSIESTTAMVERFCKAFEELESHGDSSLHNKTQWEDVKEHFRNLEKSLKKKLDELELKEKEFEEKQSKTRVLLAEREAAVAAMERALLNRLQELKDMAYSAVAEAHKKWKEAFPEPVFVRGKKDNKVSTSTNGETNAPIPVQEGKVAVKLKQLCEQMDAKGLLKFLSKSQKNLAMIRKKLSIAVKSAIEPARLVLDSLGAFYPADQTTSKGKGVVIQALRGSCIVLMESAASLLGMAECSSDSPVSIEIKQQAKAIADEWKPKLLGSLEAHAFLQLLVTFGIAPEFDEDELCMLVTVASHRRQVPELCRNLGLTHRVPGMIEALIDRRRHIDAVHFAYAFQLTEKFPPVPLLKAYLLWKTTQEGSGDTGVASFQDANIREIAALKAIIGCIEEYKLHEEYPLYPLKARLAQLEREKADKKRKAEAAKLQAGNTRANVGYAPFELVVTDNSAHYL